MIPEPSIHLRIIFSILKRILYFFVFGTQNPVNRTLIECVHELWMSQKASFVTCAWVLTFAVTYRIEPEIRDSRRCFPCISIYFCDRRDWCYVVLVYNVKLIVDSALTSQCTENGRRDAEKFFFVENCLVLINHTQYCWINRWFQFVFLSLSQKKIVSPIHEHCAHEKKSEIKSVSHHWVLSVFEFRFQVSRQIRREKVVSYSFAAYCIYRDFQIDS